MLLICLVVHRGLISAALFLVGDLRIHNLWILWHSLYHCVLACVFCKSKIPGPEISYLSVSDYFFLQLQDFLVPAARGPARFPLSNCYLRRVVVIIFNYFKFQHWSLILGLLLKAYALLFRRVDIPSLTGFLDLLGVVLGAPLHRIPYL